MKRTIIYLLCLWPILASAQLPAQLNISGSASTEVTPDITIINISINALHKDYAKSVELLQDKADEIKKFLKKKKVSEDYISSENFDINKSYAYENRKQVFMGYESTLRIRLEFKNNNELANRIINAIGESNAEADISVNFKLSQELKDKVNDQLIQAAIMDAKKKANIIAQTTEQELGQIIKINYGVQDNVSVLPQMERTFLSMDAKSNGTERNSFSITPQPVERSTDIIIYWMLQP